jgi:type I restriction enzyme S subunit
MTATHRNKVYPAYKPSGISWLGDMPQHWNIGRISYAYDVQLGKMLQPEPKSEEDELKPYLRAANLAWDGVDLSDVKEMWFKPFELKKYALKVGDVLISEGGDVGRASYLDKPLNVYIQNAINRVRPLDTKISFSKYAYYWIYTLKNLDLIKVICNASTLAHYTAEKVKATPLILPPLQEQKAIAAYLDQKTAQIDALIEKKEALLRLLAEKRATMITHAVTKGLNPKSPLKSSGIPWLGDMPAHWQVKKLGRLSDQIKTGNTPPSDDVDYFENGIIDWFTPGDFQENISLGNAQKKVSEEAFSETNLKLFPKGSILIVGIGATLGKVGISEKACTANQQINAVLPSRKIIPRFLAYSLLVKQDFMKILSNANTIGIMNQEKTKQIVLCVPPVEEQKSVILYLDQKTVEMDAVKSKTEEAVDRLKEYRTALITSAVTGKIKVI